jgi:hypothetical protein
VPTEGVGKTSTFPQVLWKTKPFLLVSASVYKTLKIPKKKIKVMINLCEINFFIKISPEVIAIILALFLQLNFRMRD